MKFMNVGVTVGNFLIADTNDSNNWDTLKFPLPKPKFKWHKVSTRLNDNTIELYDKRQGF